MASIEKLNIVPLHNNENNSVKSLFTICIEFVAKNIALVDSLEKFPDIVGKEIFHHILTTDIFAVNNTESQYVIRLFVNAYGKEFMESLCINNQGIVREFGECLSVLCLPVTRLDLRGCNLGNNDDILKIFADMKNLRVLNLAYNYISDEGFRSMLARYRMYKTGFQALEILDVSGNTVTLKVLKSLLGLPSLKVLVISIASRLKKRDTNFLSEWDKTIALKGYRLTQATDRITGDIKTKGWGANILKIWETKVTEWEILRIQMIEQRSQGFYHNYYLTKALYEKIKSSLIETDEYATFAYLRSKTITSDGNTGAVNNNSKKRCLQITNEDRIKRNRSESYQTSPTDEEMKMLMLYKKKD